MLLYRNHIESKGHCIEPYRIMTFVHCYTPTIYLFIVINFPMSFLFSCMCTLYILSLSLFNSITLSIYLSFFYLSIYISIYVNVFISLYTIYYWSASLCLTLSICDVLWKNWQENILFQMSLQCTDCICITSHLNRQKNMCFVQTCPMCKYILVKYIEYELIYIFFLFTYSVFILNIIIIILLLF